MPGDTHEAIAYSQPLILPDGTVYGVIGVELLADYLWENLPCSELQNNGTYFLAVTDTEELSASELQLCPVLRSHCDGSRVLRTKALRCASTVPIPTATSSAMPSTLLRSPP